MTAHQLTPAGRRNTLVLLVAALIVWAIAIWTFRSTVGTFPAEPDLGFFEALGRNIQNGMGVSQLVPALLTLALIVATPLVCWNLLEEYGATYTPGDDGLRFESIGIDITYPWQAMRELRSTGDAGEPAAELRFDRDYTSQIHNPVLRFLHAQAYGRRALPVPASIDQRDTLLAAITTHTGLALPDGNAAGAGES